MVLASFINGSDTYSWKAFRRKELFINSFPLLLEQFFLFLSSFGNLPSLVLYLSCCTNAVTAVALLLLQIRT